MPAFKLTMVFDYLSGDVFNDAKYFKGGWSESVYWDDISAGTIRSFNNLAVARAGLLPRYAKINGFRFQQVDPPGSSSTRAANLPGANVPENVADIPQLAVLVVRS